MHSLYSRHRCGAAARNRCRSSMYQTFINIIYIEHLTRTKIKLKFTTLTIMMMII